MNSPLNGHINTIIWDWNGTLLDDISICINAINQLLSERNLNLLTIEKYREVFTFPVIDYYKAVGFDFEKEEWDRVAHDFIRKYDENLQGASLFPDVSIVLSAFKNKNYKQYMVSAMQHEFLEQTVQNLGIRDYFIEISGIRDHFANSKISMAKSFLREHNINKQSACLIGDTLHDHEVAEALGISCILIANGHQSYSRLARSGVPVLNSLSELSGFFN
ncbi:MAG TPA: HAD family hydrolase [Bacteroidales bacterium]|nr:HAD family hydrolase [Bacteroidales bacterium]HRX96443.1 HAD family hydrolase [Bacteroidales bacterium]